ncbi:hypothetical protein [Leptothoe spongobia]|uniref:Uncharacterized protein n=1 Tax=Leptothoe spongobia TAU-MAC 1115 TaxID=1967444 RepID=A0A947DIL4_9CYAN|nr:hypothetical protein [Leptothoe spongobia]MBT9317690.1 hypothetical protein [Leptothoe spongobia TAU-MAC 1115]
MTEAIRPTSNAQSPKWQPYNLDHKAQELVLRFRDNGVLTESHKMRMAVAYGLERFWGEHLRFESSGDTNKARYWQDVWIALAEILGPTDITLPDAECSVGFRETEQIRLTAHAIWQMSLDEQRVALMVLTQLCDSLVWWTQRYRIKNSNP